MHMMSAGELRLQHGLCRRQYRRGRHGKAAGLCEACQKILQLERRHCNAAAKAAFCAQQLLNPRRRSWVQGLAWHVLPTPDATPPPPPLLFLFFFVFFPRGRHDGLPLRATQRHFCEQESRWRKRSRVESCAAALGRAQQLCSGKHRRMAAAQDKKNDGLPTTWPLIYGRELKIVTKQKAPVQPPAPQKRQRKGCEAAPPRCAA